MVTWPHILIKYNAKIILDAWNKNMNIEYGKNKLITN